jgi:hypothetical protein
MNTNSARTWAPAPAAVEPHLRLASGVVKNLHQAAEGARQTRAVGCTKESERDMAQNILSLAKSIMRKIWDPLTPAPSPAVQPRRQLNGRRVYGDDSIKPPG